MLPVVTGTSYQVGEIQVRSSFLTQTTNQVSSIRLFTFHPHFLLLLLSPVYHFGVQFQILFFSFFKKKKNEIFYSGCCCQLAARGKITAALALASHLKSSQPSLEWGRCRREKVGRSRRMEKKDRVLGNRLSYDSATLRPTHSRKSRAWGVCGD